MKRAVEISKIVTWLQNAKNNSWNLYSNYNVKNLSHLKKNWN